MLKEPSLKRICDANDPAGMIEDGYGVSDISQSHKLRDIHLPESLQLEFPDLDLTSEKFDAGGLTSLLRETGAVLLRNRQLRVQFTGEPSKFLDSELVLCETIKQFHVLALAPELYQCFIAKGGCRLLLSLLNHVNEDIAVEVLTVMVDLTDETVIEEVSAPGQLVQGFRDCAAVPVLSATLTRFIQYSSESVESVLQVVSNFIGIQPDLVSDFWTPEFVSLLVRVIGNTESNWIYSKSLAMELLVGILESLKPEKFSSLLSVDALESLLEALSYFRKTDPRDSEESEFLGNLVQTLCLALASREIRSEVADLHGVKLFTKFFLSEDSKRQRIGLKLISIAVLDNSLNCQAFVDSLGLKPLGPLLESSKEDAKEHAVSIFQSLIRSTSGVYQTRVVSKLIENDFAKTRSIICIISTLLPVVGPQLIEDDYLRRLEAGLATLQQACLVVVRLFNVGNVSIRQRILHTMRQHDIDHRMFNSVVAEYLQLLNPEHAVEEITELQDFFATLQRKAFYN